MPMYMSHTHAHVHVFTHINTHVCTQVLHTGPTHMSKHMSTHMSTHMSIHMCVGHVRTAQPAPCSQCCCRPAFGTYQHFSHHPPKRLKCFCDEQEVAAIAQTSLGFSRHGCWPSFCIWPILVVAAENRNAAATVGYCRSTKPDTHPTSRGVAWRGMVWCGAARYGVVCHQNAVANRHRFRGRGTPGFSHSLRET